MTSLKQHEGRPEIAPWLRGWEEDEEPQTTVVWRRHLPYVRHGDEITTPPAMVAKFFLTAPIHATERLEAGSGRVFDWLLKRIAQVGKRDADHDLAVKGEEIMVFLIDRAGDHVASSTMSELQRLAASAKRQERKGTSEDPGVVVLVHASHEGCAECSATLPEPGAADVETDQYLSLRDGQGRHLFDDGRETACASPTVHVSSLRPPAGRPDSHRQPPPRRLPGRGPDPACDPLPGRPQPPYARLR